VPKVVLTLAAERCDTSWSSFWHGACGTIAHLRNASLRALPLCGARRERFRNFATATRGATARTVADRTPRLLRVALVAALVKTLGLAALYAEVLTIGSGLPIAGLSVFRADGHQLARARGCCA